ALPGCGAADRRQRRDRHRKLHAAFGTDGHQAVAGGRRWRCARPAAAEAAAQQRDRGPGRTGH
nr:hypothetical protein [Tanacetum cinerariifolium]